MKFDIWKKSVENIEKEMALKYFKLSEFDDAPGTGKNMKRDFLKKLDKARELVDVVTLYPLGLEVKKQIKELEECLTQVI